MVLISLNQTEHQGLVAHLTFTFLGVDDWQAAGDLPRPRCQQVDDELDQQPQNGEKIVRWRKRFIVVEESDPDAGPGKLPIQFFLVLNLLDSGVHDGDEEIEKYDDDYRLERGEENFSECSRERRKIHLEVVLGILRWDWLPEQELHSLSKSIIFVSWRAKRLSDGIKWLGHFLCPQDEDNSAGETHEEDDVHTTDSEDVHDDLTGGYDDGAELVVELEPVEEMDNWDGGGYWVEGVSHSHLGSDFFKTLKKVLQIKKLFWRIVEWEWSNWS